MPVSENDLSEATKSLIVAAREKRETVWDYWPTLTDAYQTFLAAGPDTAAAAREAFHNALGTQRTNRNEWRTARDAALAAVRAELNSMASLIPSGAM